MLALSTLCAPAGWSLDRAVASFDVGAVALHRPPVAAEAGELRRLLRRRRLVAVFGDRPGANVGTPLLVVEGGPAREDREASLLDLCRRLHALRPLPVAVLAAPDQKAHPSIAELEVLFSELKHVGYWHDAGRVGDVFLDAAGSRLSGASFHPLETADPGALKEALGRHRPAVIVCPPGETVEALRRAEGIFGA